MDLGAYAKTYYASVSDTLKPTNQDTMDLIFQYRGNDYVKKISLRSRFDKITGADTTVKVSVDGKEFLDDAGSWTAIVTSSTSSAVTTNDVIQVLNSDWSETTTGAVLAPTVDKTYQWYRVRYIIAGNDIVGTGVKLDEVQLVLYVE
jgi:hypothetical protein